jgi:hypothetical protein
MKVKPIGWKPKKSGRESNDHKKAKKLLVDNLDNIFIKLICYKCYNKDYNIYIGKNCNSCEEYKFKNFFIDVALLNKDDDKIKFALEVFKSSKCSDSKLNNMKSAKVPLFELNCQDILDNFSNNEYCLGSVEQKCKYCKKYFEFDIDTFKPNTKIKK